MNILVVDDQKTTGLALGWTLLRQGNSPRLVTSASEAWELIQAGGWRLLITDWLMPGVDGLDLCRLIRSEHGGPYIYIMVLTGLTGRENRLEALEAGADDFLTKPVDADELAVRIAIARRILGVQTELEQTNARLQEMASTDPLTGLANRRRLQAAMEAEMSRTRSGVPCSVLGVDVDHFKAYNDSFGHSAGDDALRMVASILRSSVRESDLVARTGGEEFVVLLPGVAADEAVGIAEGLRMAIADHPWTQRLVTASFGVATALPSLLATGITEIMDESDRALYHSKRSGRNRVTHSFDLLDEASSSVCFEPDASHPGPLVLLS
jgi:diguanylate cyclase (GGDEF)-like protein